jgi:hypothetical protein
MSPDAEASEHRPRHRTTILATALARFYVGLTTEAAADMAG